MEFITHTQDWGHMHTTYIFTGSMLSMIRASVFSDDPEYLCLSDLWIFPGERGRGYSRLLLEKAISIYPDKIPYLRVKEDLSKLIAYYKRLGFEEGEIEDNYLYMYRYGK